MLLSETEHDNLCLIMSEASNTLYRATILDTIHHDNVSVKCIPAYTPLLYSKIGIYMVYIIFLFLLLNIDCVLSENKKKELSINVFIKKLPFLFNWAHRYISISNTSKVVSAYVIVVLSKA